VLRGEYQKTDWREGTCRHMILGPSAKCIERLFFYTRARSGLGSLRMRKYIICNLIVNRILVRVYNYTCVYLNTY